MKKLLCLCAFLLPMAAFATHPDDILGIWLADDNEVKVEVYKVNNEYFGKIIWLKEPNDKNGNPKKDKNNPDPAKRNNPAIGILILKNIIFKEGKWMGTIYGPKRGKETQCTLQLKSKDVLVGTVTYGLLSGSRTWQRVKE